MVASRICKRTSFAAGCALALITAVFGDQAPVLNAHRSLPNRARLDYFQSLSYRYFERVAVAAPATARWQDRHVHLAHDRYCPCRCGQFVRTMIHSSESVRVRSKERGPIGDYRGTGSPSPAGSISRLSTCCNRFSSSAFSHLATTMVATPLPTLCQ